MRKNMMAPFGSGQSESKGIYKRHHIAESYIPRAGKNLLQKFFFAAHCAPTRRTPANQTTGQRFHHTVSMR